MACHAQAAASADQVVGPHDLLASVFIEGHRNAEALSATTEVASTSELDLKAVRGQVVAQRRLRNPLGLAALESSDGIPEPPSSVSPIRLQVRTQELNLPDAHAAREKRGDDPALVEDLKDRRLERSPTRLMHAARPFVPRFSPLHRDGGVRSRR